MKFVDRIEEQKRLIKVLHGEKSAFVVVYGRRRLGKSTLMTGKSCSLENVNGQKERMWTGYFMN